MPEKNLKRNMWSPYVKYTESKHYYNSINQEERYLAVVVQGFLRKWKANTNFLHSEAT